MGPNKDLGLFLDIPASFHTWNMRRERKGVSVPTARPIVGCGEQEQLYLHSTSDGP